MANHKSAVKRARQSEKRRMRNKAVRTRVKNTVKIVRMAVAEGETESLESQLNIAKSVIDKAAQKGVIHKKTAARKISRLSNLIGSARA